MSEASRRIYPTEFNKNLRNHSRAVKLVEDISDHSNSMHSLVKLFLQNNIRVQQCLFYGRFKRRRKSSALLKGKQFIHHKGHLK